MIGDKKLISLIIKRISQYAVKIPKTVYFPAERGGINVFKNELNENRLKTYDTIISTLQFSNLKNVKDKEKMRHKVFMKNLDLIFDNKSSSVYPKPISDYLLFLNSVKEVNNDNKIANTIRKEILNGKFEISQKDNSISFRQRLGKNKFKAAIPFHIVSSSIKSLYGLDYYISSLGKSGDILIIDEPELSLSPSNQVKLAKIIAMIVDSGIKVILSTHSDVVVRSLTNVVMSNEIEKNTNIRSTDITLYNFTDREVETISDLITVNFYKNFDEPVLELQENYIELLEKLDESNEDIE